ncbi:receptor-like protein 40 [Salvia hispanica]|uniref:receptor-like protein 40 n=1 Tax=Salvia hispanica TaxID=49212 RepID=UPI0020096969|nr:receptor-like protein 40 [Salvia hispanica]
MLPNFLLLTYILTLSFIITTHSYTSRCLRHQEILLLQLKDELIFNSSHSTKLVRWNESGECCKWHGVVCDASGYVVSLELDDEAIYGGIGDSSSLFRFKYLQKLNLAFNDFNYTHPIPKGIGNLTYLTHLNLSNTGFGGQVPFEISSLTRLASLDISNEYANILCLEHPNLEMLVRNLTELRELYLDGVNITSFDERRKWSHIVSSYLPNLTSLSFSSCFLFGPLARSFWQLHSLSILRLDFTKLSTVAVPDLFTSFPNLTTLSLARCSLKGSIPSSFSNLTKLIHVDLTSNFLTGSLSSTLFEGLSNLVYLDLGFNSFSGNVPHSLFALPSLLELDLRSNKFNGTFQLDNLRNLANLTFLALSQNRLSVDVGNVNSTSYGCLQLKVLYLASCNLSHFPDFIRHLDMEGLELSDNRIAGEIPSWIWGKQLMFLNLSHNLLTDLQKPYHIPTSLQFLDLHSNRFRGEVRLPLPLESQLWYLSLANNSLSGSIATSLCNAKHLDSLDFSGNKLSGRIPPCVLENVRGLDLSRNNISGSIPDIFSKDCRLQYLELNNNNLDGKIPKSLKSCRSLKFLDVGNNNINDSFPCMLPSRLLVLVLHSNRFYGEVRCHHNWPDLQVLDISSNYFSGSLKSINFSSWRAMVLQSDEHLRRNSINVKCMLSSMTLRVLVLHSNGRVRCHNNWAEFPVIDTSSNYFSGSLESLDFSSWRDRILQSDEQLWLRYNSVRSSPSVTLIMKGLNLELHNIWRDFGSIDFSSNNFHGEIPNAIGDLTSLHHLNFSLNTLNGSIPKSFGQLRNLESLDLSGNQLTGMIPVELASITFLSFLNLSYNKLVGVIPNGPQFQTFTNDDFEGNAGLCGFPLNKSCSHTDDNDSELSPREHEDVEEKREIEWEYVSAALGYVVGVGIIVWLLLFCRRFREKYFGKIEEVEGIFIARDMRRRRTRMVARNRARRHGIRATGGLWRHAKSLKEVGKWNPLSRGDSLWKVDHEESAAEMWKLLDTLYTETSMSSRIYLLEKLIKFKLDLAKDIDDINVDRFKKLVHDIKRSGDKTIDEYTSIALMNAMMNAIPDSYSDVKAAIKYGRDSAPLDLIISSLKSKELELRERAADKNAYNKVLNVRGRSKSRGGNETSSGSGNTSNSRKKFKSRSRSKDPKTYRRCFNCGEVGHNKKACTKPKKNKFPNHNAQVETLVNVATYDNVNDSVFLHLMIGYVILDVLII